MIKLQAVALHRQSSPDLTIELPVWFVTGAISIHHQHQRAVHRLLSHWCSLFFSILSIFFFSIDFLSPFSLPIHAFPPHSHPTSTRASNALRLAAAARLSCAYCIKPFVVAALFFFSCLLCLHSFFTHFNIIIFFKYGAPWYKKEIKKRQPATSLYRELYMYTPRDPVNVYYSRW